MVGTDTSNTAGQLPKPQVLELLRASAKERQEEKLESAMKLISDALELSPADPDGLFAFGILSLDAEQLEPALDARHYLKRLYPSHPWGAVLESLIVLLHPSTRWHLPPASFQDTGKRALLLGDFAPSTLDRLIKEHAPANPLVVPQKAGEGVFPSFGVLTQKKPLELLADVLKHRSFAYLVVPHAQVLQPDGLHLFDQVQAFKAAMVLFDDGSSRQYLGEDLHRLHYNTAYLRAMAQKVPTLKGSRVLDVGCSDGLICDFVAFAGAAHVTGIDMLPDVGHRSVHPNTSYHRMDVTDLTFPDASFDRVFSIATLEHVSDPKKASAEIKRVLSPGGYAFLQAGPLYFSAFGHHMFGHFDDLPWIHARRSVEEIVKIGIGRGLEQRIQAERQMGADLYIRSMLSKAHVNMLPLPEYHLETLMNDPELEVLDFQKSVLFEELLTKELEAEVLLRHPELCRDNLLEQGFWLTLRKR